MAGTINLGEISADLIRKDIKNVHLSVYPPNGRVRISAPKRMRVDTIRVFAIAKLEWIKRQQKSLRDQERETPREIIDLESVYAWGKRYRVDRHDVPRGARIELKHDRLALYCRPDRTTSQRRAYVDLWYREQLRQAVPQLLEKWEPQIGVKSAGFFVQRMKTRWGSCNTTRRTIRLNSELAKKPIECLEFIVVHELVHLIERTHNDHFVSILDRHLPDWSHRRSALNSLPVRGEDWKY